MVIISAAAMAFPNTSYSNKSVKLAPNSFDSFAQSRGR